MLQKSKNEQRRDFIQRVSDDFTFSGHPTATQSQRAMWLYVQMAFDIFRREVEQLIHNTGYKMIALSDEYDAHKVALRDAERWVNMAIAKDYVDEHDAGFRIENVQRTMDYPLDGNEAELPVKQLYCRRISITCHALAVDMVMNLPHGRPMSVAMTQLQSVRGWLIDMINEHVPDTSIPESGESDEDINQAAGQVADTLIEMSKGEDQETPN